MGGVAGGILLTGIFPVVGSLGGALAGALIGLIVVEYYDKRRWGAALRAAAGYAIGWLVSNAVELALCVLMLGIFAWRAFF